ncbi:MAG: hypothetical protein IT371_03330 [Deltaproteobacteria bacterium]|nr:hypothetical protein [Deltaproteobacteria bacterium]
MRPISMFEKLVVIGRRWSAAALLVVLAGWGLGCGGFEFGKACGHDGQCDGEGVCQERPLSTLPEKYCTKTCESGPDVCPADYECVTFKGTSAKPRCIKKTDVAAYQ